LAEIFPEGGSQLEHQEMVQAAQTAVDSGKGLTSPINGRPLENSEKVGG